MQRYLLALVCATMVFLGCVADDSAMQPAPAPPPTAPSVWHSKFGPECDSCRSVCRGHHSPKHCAQLCDTVCIGN